MPAPDGSLLCLFSNDKCILIDDFTPALQGIYKITDIWPQLAPYNMGDTLDAAYYCPEFTEVAFFKKDQCAVYNYTSKKWIQGAISTYFKAPASAGTAYNSNLTAASTGVNDVYYAFYSGNNYINGPIAGQDPFVAPVQLNNATGTITGDGWKLTATQKLVASTLVAELTAYGPQGDGKLERCLFVQDSSDGQYYFTFDQEGVTGFTPVPGVKPLSQLWSGYSDSEYPIQAATRVSASFVANVSPLPSTPQGPGPVLNPNGNPLCDELGNIMKSVCSLTLLMHKAIDACYPQSSWPTQPYPDGCSSKHHRCGCQGQSGGSNGSSPHSHGPVKPNQ